jgi:hypothetical protein
MDRTSLIVISSIKIEGKKEKKKSYHNQALRNVERRRAGWVNSGCVSGSRGFTEQRGRKEKKRAVKKAEKKKRGDRDRGGGEYCRLVFYLVLS